MGSVEKRIRDSRTRWYARYRDHGGQQRVKVFDRKTDAEKYLTTVEASKLTNTFVDPKAGALTVEQFYAVWSARQIWTPGTEKAMSLAIRSTTFTKLRMRDLRPSHLEAWVKAMTVKGLAPGTIRTRFNNVHSMLRAALRDRMIASDPADGVRLPRGRAREAAMTIPTVEQVGALLDAADDRFLVFLALCAFAGLRLGEAAAVQVGDIDFLRRTLDVRRQVQRAGMGQVDIRPPKYGSERTVYLPDGLVQILARHLEACGTGADPAAWLFLGERDDPPHQNTVGYWWRKTRTAAGVQFKLHDCRHFFASGLIADGCDVVTVQRALGHKSATTTLNTYSHLWPSAEDRTRAASGRMLASALAGVYPSCTGDASDGP
jgi:integrase